ncbi:MAG: YdcF family protein [Parasporobacterium sp.]|nr:YdcF family protein [Parasporobacterium sp.]
MRHSVAKNESASNAVKEGPAVGEGPAAGRTHTVQGNPVAKVPLAMVRWLVAGLLTIAMVLITACGTGDETGQMHVQTNRTEISTDPVADLHADTPAATEQESTDPGMALVSRLIAAYESGARSRELNPILNELKQQDAELAGKWQQILSYWEEVNEPGFTNVPKDVSAKTTANDPADPLPADLPADDSLCLIVLGFGLKSDGSMRPELIDRLETALACAEQYPNARILVTGGGTASKNPEATEADSMAEWLVSKGVTKQRILIENRSRTTAENAAYSGELLRREASGVRSTAIITSDYHVPLGCLLFESWFVLTSGSGEPDIQVSSNAACLAGTYEFTVRDQANWLRNLITLELINNRQLPPAAEGNGK